MFAGEDVVEVTLISCPRTLECMNPFLHMILIDSRSDFRCKKDFLNYRCQVDKQKNPFYYTNRPIGGVACYIRLT